MRLFISWSGPRSKAFAEYLQRWLKKTIQAVEPWLSSEIPKGARWSVEIAARLEQSEFGIVCLTRDNLHAPWILFEAGALSKKQKTRVCTILLGVDPDMIEGPLEALQHTRTSKVEMLALARTVNECTRSLGENALSEEVLGEAFESHWPELRRAIEVTEADAGLDNSGIGFDQATAFMDGLRQTLREVWKKEAPILHREVLHHCHLFAENARPWSQGTYRAPHTRYPAVLVDLYRLAQRSVFATCIPQYLSTWTEDLGRRILKAHENASAAVTRVFRFDNRSEVTEAALRVMRQHARTKNVTVRVFIDAEEPYQFPQDVSRDFTLIDDGWAIGITSSYGASQREATWHFGDETKARVLREIRKSLLESSVLLVDFEQGSHPAR